MTNPAFSGRRRRTLTAVLGVAMLSTGILTGMSPASAAPADELQDRFAAEALELAEQRLRPADAPAEASGRRAPAANEPGSAPTVEGLAVTAEGHTISGLVTTLDLEGGTAPAAGVLVHLAPAWDAEEEFDGDWVPEDDEDWILAETQTDADGAYSFAGVPDGDYTLWFDPGADSEYWPDYLDVTVAGGDVLSADMVFKPEMPYGELAAVGSPVLGQTLTVVPSGWPDGATFTYLWIYGSITGPDGIEVGLIDDASDDSYTVTPEHIGAYVVVGVLVEHPAYSAALALTGWEDPISAPKKAPVSAPVADSGDLSGFLASHGSTPQPQTSAGLPAGSLSPAKDYTAEVAWPGADSFVDVYAYSTPTFVGTFPVVDGVAQVGLDADLLNELGGGAHTLVLLGQTSGDVGSLRLTVAAMLAATGAEPLPAFAAGALLTLLGGAVLAVRRRTRAGS
jgi:hypothetical protein